jgi:glycopeptide antibiotics resistance protein
MMRGLVYLLPLLLPVLVISLGIGVVLARPLARRLGTHVLVAFLLVTSLGLIVASTLTPHVGALQAEARVGGWCDLSRLSLAPLSLIARPNDVSLNILLFVPLGLAVGALPPGHSRARLALGALALPFVIELIQSLVTALGRGCESADVIDNLTGLVIGLSLGSAAGWLGRRSRHDAGGRGSDQVSEVADRPIPRPRR